MTRAETIAEHERMRGEAWCKLKGLKFFDVNELGVWYSRKVEFDKSVGLVDSHGCASWKEVNRDLADHADKFAYLNDEAESVRLDDTPQNPDARDEL